ncbi:Alpha/Beta hydrolase protein [Pestalotiopsis sp. NC0098]|nr:Alpha/Beta hydrolase protein [Pestalotiopsis sp. NC0098]
MTNFEDLVLKAPPPLDPAWLAHEEAAGLRKPKPVLTAVERQPVYASDCRARNAAMMAPGARDHDLSSGIHIQALTVPSRVDKDHYRIPVLKYTLANGENHGQIESEERDEGRRVVLFYIHGGGLLVGEADSEELSCRRLVKHFSSSETGPGHDPTNSQKTSDQNIALYSVGYRLMPQVPAQTCLSDVISAFQAIRQIHQTNKFIVIGSSSGGELAALLSQSVPPESIQGILLRCPVTVDAPSIVPPHFAKSHTSASQPFETSLLGRFHRQVPRDGLEKMPLEMPADDVGSLKLPRTWIQVCTNDVLYSDGTCYAELLENSGVEVKVDVIAGWPHTFWLKAPHLDRALEAENAMLGGLDWVLAG